MKIAVVATFTVDSEDIKRHANSEDGAVWFGQLAAQADLSDVLWTHVAIDTLSPPGVSVEGTPLEYPTVWEPWIAAIADARAKKCGYDITAKDRKAAIAKARRKAKKSDEAV